MGIVRAVLFFFLQKKHHTYFSSCQIKHHKNKRAVWKVSFLSSLVTMSIDVWITQPYTGQGRPSTALSQADNRQREGWVEKERRGEMEGVEEEMVVAILSGHAGWAGSGALKAFLLFLPSIHP